MKNQKHTAQRGAFARAALLGGAALSIGMTAQAPTTYAQGIEVITVTAQRREQNLQDVGIAINAYSQQDLIQLGIENSTEIALFTPGVFVSASGAGQNSQFTIRGVTQNDFNAALEGPIAAYFDESYIPTLQGQIFATFDVNRVEILKGPQGTLFGRNATGGLVHYIPNKPTEEFEGYVQAGYGRFNRFEIEGAVGGGITEGLSARVSVLYNQRDGFLENIYPAGVTSPLAAGTPPRGADFNDLGNEENFGIRGQLQFEPNERFTARLTASYSEQTGSTNPYNVRPSQPVFNDAGQQIDTVYLPRDQPILTTLAFVLGLGDGEFLPPGFDGFIAPDPESLQTSTDAAIDEAFNNEVLDFSLHLNYEFDGFDLVSITDYKELNSALLTDVEASPINFVN
ncbi:MAG: TonB-dependent receptor plug domain-containing protein, partial [Pseudomonadota bacterium]